MIISSKSLYLLILYIVSKIKTFESSSKINYNDFLLEGKSLIYYVIEYYKKIELVLSSI